MPSVPGNRTKKHARVRNPQTKTRHHSNLRPKHKQTKDFLKVYYPYLPLLSVVLIILAIVQPWTSSLIPQKVLPYATDMSITELAEETNEHRERNKRDQLQLNKKLSSAAELKARDMVQRNYWSHNTPDGKAPWVFINDADYSYKKAGENLAYGFVNESEVISGWMNSEGHRANILDNDYQHVGFGFAESSNFDGNGPATVVVAMYATPANSSKAITEAQNELPVANSENALGAQETILPKNISRLETYISNLNPWIPYAVGLLLGALTTYLAIKHGLAIKNAIKNGERYVLRHPLFDATILAVIVLGVLISQRAGFVL